MAPQAHVMTVWRNGVVIAVRVARIVAASVPGTGSRMVGVIVTHGVVGGRDWDNADAARGCLGRCKNPCKQKRKSTYYKRAFHSVVPPGRLRIRGNLAELNAIRCPLH